MLRKIRLTFAMICFALITLLFLDFTGTLHGWFGWLAKIQFLPAVLALNVGVILFLVILTLVCGRIYCSVICPLGVFQDILAWLGRQPKKRRKLPYSYSPALSWLRYGIGRRENTIVPVGTVESCRHQSDSKFGVTGIMRPAYNAEIKFLVFLFFVGIVEVIQNFSEKTAFLGKRVYRMRGN